MALLQERLGTLVECGQNFPEHLDLGGPGKRWQTSWIMLWAVNVLWFVIHEIAGDRLSVWLAQSLTQYCYADLRDGRYAKSQFVWLRVYGNAFENRSQDLQYLHWEGTMSSTLLLLQLLLLRWTAASRPAGIQQEPGAVVVLGAVDSLRTQIRTPVLPPPSLPCFKNLGDLKWKSFNL